VLAKYLKGEGKLADNKMVATIMSGLGLGESLKAEGVDVQICGIGDRTVYQKMTECGIVLGGEQSGHIILSKYESTGDGLVTAILFMEALINSKGKASELVKNLKKYPQVLVNVPVKDKKKVLEFYGVQSEVLRVREKLATFGRVLVRPSGTEQVIRIMVECADEQMCKNYANCIASAISNADGEE
jgi:phosphoglucosamine mutase